MSAHYPEPRATGGVARKFALVVVLAAVTLATSGYFMGLRQVERSLASRRGLPPVAEEPLADTATAEAVPAAPAYWQLREREHQPNRGWRTDLAMLAPAPAFTGETARLDAATASQLSALRAERRAYGGAPPVVPHPIDQQQSASCLACHGRPTRVGSMDVPQISHPPYSQCIQCHAPAQGPGPRLRRPGAPLNTPLLDNTFAGHLTLARGTRAHAEAPPTVPHTTHMRSNCLSCHGPGGSSVVKTSHPQRQSCVQCHALDAARETLPRLALERDFAPPRGFPVARAGTLSSAP